MAGRRDLETLPAPDEPSAHTPAGPAAELSGATLLAPEEAAEAPMVGDPSVGELVAGRYRLVRLVGTGGGGRVYEGVDTFLAEPAAARVAVKRIPRTWWGQAGYARREVTSLRYLRLPGVVRLRDDGVDATGWFIVMDLVEGEPLFDPRRGPLPWSAVEGPLAALLDTLSHVHAAGIVHRDLKPGNVLLVDGAPVVLDFGIALGAALAPDAPRGEGTPGHMAPEQARGERCDARTDLYAVAVMAWNALSGGGPIAAATLAVAEDAAPVEEAPVDAPPHVLGVLRRMLAPDPADRPASAEEVLLALGAPPLGRRLDGVLAGVVESGDFSEEALRALFHGPDAFLHLREDAAALLLARTGGVRARVADELERWIRRSLARLDGDRVRVERPALDRLTIDASGFRTDADPAIVIADATARAAAYRREGRTALAAVLVEHALATARAAGDVAAETRLLHELVELAFAQESSIALEEALYELGRAHAPGAVEGLVGLLRGWKAVQSGQKALAAQLLGDLGIFEDERLEIRKLGLRSNTLDPKAREAFLVGLSPWADTTPRRRSKLDGWLGNLRYEQGEYAEAARLHLASTDLREHADERLSCWYNAACALLEVPDLDGARRLAEGAVERARAARAGTYEAGLTWVARAAAYRMGAAARPRVDLVEACGRVAPGVQAMYALTEAAIAWRGGHSAETVRLAGQARAWYAANGAEGVALLAEALAAASQRPIPPTDLQALEDRAARTADASISVQVYGLLHLACDGAQGRFLESARRIARDHWPPETDTRLDVLSVAEATGVASLRRADEEPR